MKRPLTTFVAVLVFTACGARTGLGLVLTDDPTGAGLDARGDTSTDPRDASTLDPRDASTLDPRDASTEVEAEPTYKEDCVDAGVTYIYVITSDAHLYSFSPPTGSFTDIGVVSCPTAPSTVLRPIGANSMAVDRRGTAYVGYSDGSLFRVSTATAACAATTFVPGQRGWGKFGMGFATDLRGPSETLYVAESANRRPSLGLATVDVSSYAFAFVGPFSKPLGNSVELTGTGDGHLYGFFPASPGPGSYLAEIDKASASLLRVTDLPIGAERGAFAFSFWGGDFYFFVAPEGVTTVTRYRPSDRSLVDVATLPSAVVGAGASTCAPE